jgi:uncharacterized protein (DUF2062 family)
MSLLGRGNVPLAVAFTWVSNPLTWVPCFWLAYLVGLPLTPAEPVEDLKPMIREAMDAGFVAGMWQAGGFLLDNLPRLYPMYIGGVILGFATGGSAYVFVNLLWRIRIVRRWHRRHHERRKLNPKQMLTSGFAHLARRRPRALRESS